MPRSTFDGTDKSAAKSPICPPLALDQDENFTLELPRQSAALFLPAVETAVGKLLDEDAELDRIESLSEMLGNDGWRLARDAEDAVRAAKGIPSDDDRAWAKFLRGLLEV